MPDDYVPFLSAELLREHSGNPFKDQGPIPSKR
jgi:hypothetical protein